MKMSSRTSIISRSSRMLSSRMLSFLTRIFFGVLELGLLFSPDTTLVFGNTGLMKDLSLFANGQSATQAEIAQNWVLRGTAVPMKDSKIVMGPGTLGRAGYIFSNLAIPSNDFEITFKFSFTSSTPTTTPGDDHKLGLGFWVVQDHDPLSEDLQAILHDTTYLKSFTLGAQLMRSDRDLFGYKSRFNGIGAVFTTRTVDYENGLAKSKFEEGAVGAVNDGSRSMFTNGDIASQLATKVGFRNRPEPTIGKLRVTPNSAKLEVMQNGQWVSVMNENKPIQKNSKIGFTYLVSDPDIRETNENKAIKKDKVIIHEISTMNFDAGIEFTNSEIKDLKKQESGDFLYEHGQQKENREESAAIHQLTNMVMRLIAENEPVRAEMERTITGLSQRIISLEKIFVDLKHEINNKTGHDLEKEFEDIKKELLSLSEVATTETKKRKEKMKELNRDLETIKKDGGGINGNGGGIDSHMEKLTASNNLVLESLNTGHRWSLMVSIFAISLIIFAGLALYQRFRSWEKKHIL